MSLMLNGLKKIRILKYLAEPTIHDDVIIYYYYYYASHTFFFANSNRGVAQRRPV